MNLFIVILSKRTDNINYQDKLLKVGNVYQLTEDTFLISSPLKSTEIRDYIVSEIKSERVYVTYVGQGAAWSNVLTSNSVIKDLYNNK